MLSPRTNRLITYPMLKIDLVLVLEAILSGVGNHVRIN